MHLKRIQGDESKQSFRFGPQTQIQEPWVLNLLDRLLCVWAKNSPLLGSQSTSSDAPRASWPTDRELRCPPMTSILPWTMAGLLLCLFLTSPFSFARLCNSSGQVDRSFGAEGEVYGFSKNLWEFRLKHVKNSKWTQAYWHVPLTGTWLQV